MEICFAIIY